MVRLAGRARNGKRVKAAADAPPPTLQALWAIGRYDLRLCDDEFWSLTPRQFAWLYERHLDERKRLELIVGYNTSAIINSSFNPPEKPVAPARFMPSMFEPEPEMTEEEKTLHLSDMFKGLMERQNAIAGEPTPKRTRKRKK